MRKLGGTLLVGPMVFGLLWGFGCTVETKSSTDDDAGGGTTDPNDSGTGTLDSGPGTDAGDSGSLNTGPIKRTLVYHDLTAGENNGADGTKGVAFSRDGTLGLFSENGAGGYKPTTVSTLGIGRKTLDTVSAGWIDQTALNADGSLAVYVTDAMNISSTATPARVVGPAISQSQSWTVFSKDPLNAAKWRLNFQVDRAWAPSNERGVFSIAEDGKTDLKSVVTLAQGATLAGVTADTIGPKAGRRELDVSADGKRFVSVWSAGSCTQTGQKDYIFAGNVDGTDRRVIKGPLTVGCGVSKVALSADGNTIAYEADKTADGNQKEVTIVGFDGANSRVLATVPGNRNNNWGLSENGTRLLAGEKLHQTDGSGSFDVAVQGGFFSGDPASAIDIQHGLLSGAGNRAFYLNTYAIPVRAAVLEIDPASTGLAPAMSNPTVTPASLPGDGTAAATVTVKVAGEPFRVALAILDAGSRDAPAFGDIVLHDDGTHGDVTAKDGVFTTNELRPTAGTKAGPRTIRLRATTYTASASVSGATMAHSTVIDVEPFAVQ